MPDQEALREIRNALLGRTMTTRDGRLCVMGEGDFRIPIGVGEGSMSIRVLGVSCSAWRFESSLPPQRVMEIALQCMHNIGREIILRESPYAAASFIRSVFVRPVVMTFSYEGEVPVLSIYTGRSLTSPVAVRRAFRSFTDQLPSTIMISGKIEKEKKEKKNKKEVSGE